MEEFHNQINHIRLTADDLKTTDFDHFINETEQIGQQLKSSQNFLLKEIQRLKKDLDVNYTKLNYANELRTIDQITLKTFQTKFQELTQILADVKMKEINTWHFVQMLRVNTSRLWNIFETTTGTTISQELIYEDLQKLLNLTKIEKDEQSTCLILLEKEHGDLLLKMKEIQLSLERFRTTILQMTQNTKNIQSKTHHQQQINDQNQEQVTKKINHLISNTKEVQTLLFLYKNLVDDSHYLLKLIFHIQTQIEIHHKSILIYQTKLEKYKQDLTLIPINRTNYQTDISHLQKIIHQQNQNFKKLENQHTQTIINRQQLHQQIHSLEIEKSQLLIDQQQLLNTIKQTTTENNLLEKEVFHGNHAIKDLQYSHRQLTKDHHKQQNITYNLQKTIGKNDQQLRMTKEGINQLTEHIKQQNQLMNQKENRIDSYTKDLLDLENCLSTTHEELLNQRSKVEENKDKMKILTQKMHKLITDGKPLMKEISRYQQQIAHNETKLIQLESNLKQNEVKISQYKTIVSKLTKESNENDRILTRETASLQQYHYEQQKSDEDRMKLNNSLKSSEFNYHNLKEISHYIDNKNRQLKQEYEDLTMVVQLLGQRHALLNNDMTSLYGQIKRLTQQHLQKVKITEQSKSDLAILQKYDLHLRTYHRQLRQSVSFKSQQHHEYLSSQSISNQYTSLQNQFEREKKRSVKPIHCWHTLMISSPDKFNNIAKLILIKKKLVKKSHELLHLKQIFYEKETLYNHLNRIHIRREKFIGKLKPYDVLKKQLIKRKTLRNQLKSNIDECESITSTI